VVDRFKVRDDLALRLAESFETALTLSGGIVLVVPMDGEDGVAPMTFSANFACPECGHSMSELEPRIFSFNNPAGACPTCDGLGVQQYFDPAKLIHDPGQSLAGRRHPWLGQAQLLLLPDAEIPGRALQVRPGDAPGRICRSRPRR
jgi:excinuclease ABC subunit A